MHRRHVSLVAVAAVACLASPRPAWAHKLNVFAHVEGSTIHGRAYFSGMAPARDVPVMVLGPGEEKLGQTQTDDQGQFTFAATSACDHRLVVESGDGHKAEYVVTAAELRGGLAGQSSPDLTAVLTQIALLRDQLDTLRQETRIHDVVGAIGYIFGIAGLAFYFLGVRRRGRSLPTATAPRPSADEVAHG